MEVAARLAGATDSVAVVATVVPALCACSARAGAYASGAVMAASIYQDVIQISSDVDDDARIEDMMEDEESGATASERGIATSFAAINGGANHAPVVQRSQPVTSNRAGGSSTCPSGGALAADGTTTSHLLSSVLCDPSRTRLRKAGGVTEDGGTSLFLGNNSMRARAPRRGTPLTSGAYPALHGPSSTTWLWPSSDDYGDREYQLQIASVCLFQNTLVSLPTGLGKVRCRPIACNASRLLQLW